MPTKDGLETDDTAARLPLTTPSRRALDALRALRMTTRDGALERVRGRARSGVETVDGTVARALVRGAARVFMRRKKMTVEDKENADARGTRRDDVEDDDDVRYVYEYDYRRVKERVFIVMFVSLLPSSSSSSMVCARTTHEE